MVDTIFKCIGKKIRWLCGQFSCTTAKFTQTRGMFVQFTWKEECNYRAYLFILFVVVNPRVFPSKLLLAYPVDCLYVSCTNLVCNPVGFPVQSCRNSCVEKWWCLPCCSLLGYETELWEWASRKCMHECMGMTIVSSYGHLGWGGVLATEERFHFFTIGP